MGMQPTLAIPYVRFSDTQQESGSSRERQREVTADAIARLGWTAAPFVEDLGKSAYHGDHLKGELGKLTARVLAGEYLAGTVIVAERIDRLSRQGYDALTAWMRVIVDAGLRIMTVDDGKIYDAANLSKGLEGQMVRLMKAEVAREYVETMRGRVITGIRARQAKARETGRPSSLKKATFDNLPGWLRWEGGEIVFVGDQADIVRDVYAWSADGLGGQGIATRLNHAKRLTPRGKDWQPSTIYKLLRSPAVEGDLVQTEDGVAIGTVHGAYPAVVDADLVKRARDAMGRRKRLKGAGPSKTFVNLFASVAICGGCAGRLHVQPWKNPRTGEVKRHFRCNGASRGACDCKSMFSYTRFEGPALDAILPLALDDRFFSKGDTVRPLAMEVAALEKTVADLEARSKRLVRMMMMTDDIDPIMEEEQTGLRKTIAVTRGRLADAGKALAAAKGAVDDDAHLARVLEVREAMSDPDLDTAMAARRSVRDAIGTVVDRIISEIDAQGRKSLLVIMAGTLVSFRVHDDGTVGERHDRTRTALGNLDLFNAASAVTPEGEAGLVRIISRMAG